MTTDQTELETLRDEVKEQAATAAGLRDIIRDLRKRNDQMRALVAEHIAKALASRDHDRWHAADALAKAFDEARCNVDGAINRSLTEEGWDPRSAWKDLASCGARCGTRDPWEPATNANANVPEPVRRVLAGRLADMLLDPRLDETRAWARGMTFALKEEGLDLTDVIRKRITDITLGPDPSDPPF
ncbi:hypothetical protein [Streptomyces sp. NBC_01789]|uniref:hypothetical protein n=1 Tax=Streptomyces sp. NBC_01789 TaxID=2975941 RepID=UPI00224E4733|nr:hypothetical protein [Streptomyces sp. NBC_01789]MCX4450631.1 hypothetical protein [Streptomyces sp. NBC_01789]